MAELPTGDASKRRNVRALPRASRSNRSSIPLPNKKSHSPLGVTFPTERSLMSSSPSNIPGIVRYGGKAQGTRQMTTPAYAPSPTKIPVRSASSLGTSKRTVLSKGKMNTILSQQSESVFSPEETSEPIDDSHYHSQDDSQLNKGLNLDERVVEELNQEDDKDLPDTFSGLTEEKKAGLYEETEDISNLTPTNSKPLLTGSTSNLRRPTNNSTSSSETEFRNAAPLSLEIENLSRDQVGSNSYESVTGSENSLASHRSLPTTMAHLSGSVASGPLALIHLEEQVEASSLPELDDQFNHQNERSEALKQYHQMSSRIDILVSEKRSVETLLQQAQKRIQLLEADNTNLTVKAEEELATIQAISKEYQDEIASLHKNHTEEMVQSKKQAQKELETERQRLLIQIREIKETKEQEVDGLKETLSELASSSSINSEKVEFDEMKVELQALQELQHETEKSYQSLLESSKKLEERLIYVTSENKALVEKIKDGKISNAEENALEHEKVNVRDLQNQLDTANATINVRDKCIEEMKMQLLTQAQTLESAAAGKKRKEPVSARYLGDTIAFNNKRTQGAGYVSTRGGRGGKLDTGDSPQEADREHLQDWKREKEIMEGKLKAAEQKLDTSERAARATQEVLKKKLEEMFQRTHAADELNGSVHHKHQEILSENHELKSKLIDLRGKLMDKSVLLNQTEGDLAGSRREVSFSQNELSLERHQKGLLQSKVGALESQLQTQKKELMELHDNTKERLSSAGQQTRQEVSSLKAKVGELEGEISLLKQQLGHVTEQRDSLEAQLDSITSQVMTVESQLIKERTITLETQSKLESLEDNCRNKGEEVMKGSKQCDELQIEISTLRKELKVARENCSTMETELKCLRIERDNCNAELSKTTNSVSELEKKLLSTTSNLSHFQDLARRLQKTITVTQHDLDVTSSSLENEKQTNKELQATVDSLSGNLERSGKKLEGMDVQYMQSKKELLQSKLEVEQMHFKNNSLQIELKQAQETFSALQNQLDRRERESTSQGHEIAQSMETVSDLRQKLTVTSKEMSTLKHKLEECLSQITSNEIERLKLMKEKQAAGIELQDEKSKHLSTNRQLTEKKKLLQDREGEIRDLKQDKMSLTTELSESKRECHSVTSSKNKLGSDLEFKASQLEQERKKGAHAHQELQKRMEEIQSLQTDLGKMKCGINSEKEQNKSLVMEQANIQEKLQTSREQNKRHCQELEALKEKSERDQLMIQQFQGNLNLANEQLRALKSEYSKLEVDSKKSKEQLKTATNEVSEMKGRLSGMSVELETTTEIKEAIEKQLDLAQQQLTCTNSTVAHKFSELEQTNKKLSLCKSQLTDALQGVEKQKELLSTEKANCVRLQAELKRKEDSLLMVKLETEQFKEERECEKRMVATLSTDIAHCQAKNQELSRDLLEEQKELDAVKSAAKETENSLNCTLTSIKGSHEEEREKAASEIDSIRMELTQAKEFTSITEKQLNICGTKLTSCTTKLIDSEHRCQELESNLQMKTNAHTSLEANHLHLESSHASARSEISQLNKKLAAESAMYECVKTQLGTATRECSALKEQLQLQRETAASSLSKMQKQNHETCTELHTKIQEFSQTIKTAHVALREAQQELSKMKAENNTLVVSLKNGNEKSKELKGQLQEQMTSLKLVEQRMEQFQASSEMERNAKIQLQETLAEERLKLQQCEVSLEEQKEVFASTMSELKQCRSLLTKEGSVNDRLSHDLIQLKDELTQTKRQVEAIKELQRSTQVQGEREITSIKQKCHGEKKSLKERIRDLQANLQAAVAQHDIRGNEIGRLQANNQTLNEDYRDACRKLSSMEQKHRDKKEECGHLKIKLQALEVQVTQLQAEVGTLEKTQLQLDEFKKRSDTKSKLEMQRVLGEVTQHMEQQYSAHRYLEKLRTENETIAIKEKERLVAQLKSELKHRKQECKQDKLQLEQVQLEAAYLKTQQKEQDRSRRRLEVRLEQVNDTLSRSLPSNSQNSFAYRSSGKPLFCSTPNPKTSRTCNSSGV